MWMRVIGILAVGLMGAMAGAAAGETILYVDDSAMAANDASLRVPLDCPIEAEARQVK